LVGGGSTLNSAAFSIATGNTTMNDLASISLLNNMGSVSSNSNTINNTNNSIVSGANLASSNAVGSVGGNNANLLNGILTSRGPQLPITVQKANREDINEKFCKFEINKSMLNK
jgi:hypothetical protein